MLWLVFVLSLVSFGLLSATVAESYSSVPREDKQNSDSMAEQDDWVDLHRPYVVNLEDEERREKEMRKRNMYLPEKALSAYDFFAKEERLKLKEKNPNYPEEELDKEIDKLWKEADFETKAKYGRLAGIDRARYLGEYETYVYTKYDLEFDDEGNLIEDSDLASDEVQPGTSQEKQNSPEMAGEDYSVDLHRQNRIDEPEVAPVCESKRRRRDPNLPKRPLSAFFWFTNEERSKVKANYPDYSVSEIAKELGKRWGEADPETKAKFERIAEYDRKRYEQTGTSDEEQNSPNIADQDDSVDQQNHEPEDPPVCDNEPEKRDPKWSMRPQTAFFWFCNEERSKVKASHPEYSVVEIAKEMAKRWKDADPEAKAKFERIAEYDRKRYGQETEVVKKRKKVDDDNDFHGDAGTSTCNR